MIEIVYDKATAEKNAKNDGHYRMPKNIRQIGNAPDKKKIYIEDYVMTFLRKIAEPGNTTSRGAILLGEYFKDGDTETLFISGAVEAQNLEFDVEQIKFDDHIWSKLYADINKYFETYPGVKKFLDGEVAKGKEMGYVLKLLAIAKRDGNTIEVRLLWILWNVMMPFMYVRRTG